MGRNSTSSSMVRSLCLLGLTAFLGTAAPQAGADPACSNEATRIEQHSTALADCRAYEMVSPPDKNGGDVIAKPMRTQVAVDGEAVEFSSLVSFGNALGAAITSEYIAERDGLPGTQGWSTHSILPKLDPFSPNGVTQAAFNSTYVGEFSTDLSKGILRTGTNLSGDPNLSTIANLYLREDALSPGPGTYSTVTPCPACSAPFMGSQQLSYAEVGGSTPDLGHIVFETSLNLTVGASGEGRKVYEFDHGVLRLVSILPLSEGGAMAPSAILGRAPKLIFYSPNLISDDGRRIFFTATSSIPAGTLYMRVDGTETVRISAAQPAIYQTASADGTRVFFTEAEHLWMYDANAGEGEHLTDIAAVGSDAGVVGTDAGGSFVYFLSHGKFVAGQPNPSTGSLGIYVWHAGEFRFIGILKASGDWTEDALPNQPSLGYPSGSRISPDGRTLLFTSHSGVGLGNYQQNGPGCGASGCRELYRYSFDSDSRVCVSCNPSGAPATGDASITAESGGGASGGTSHITHPLSDDGRFVFFTSHDSLLAEDTNGVSDAYEYDAQTGQLHLLSSGRSSDGSYFLDAAPSGSDAFFATREPLVGWDVDGAVDLYDAPAGGGFPEPPPQPAVCSGEACQGTPGASAGGQQPTAASAFFFGPGNQKICRHPRRRHHRKCSHRKRTAGANRGGAK